MENTSLMVAGKPRIAVIIAVFNGEGTIARCLDSIARQKFGRCQVIVIDGGSVDGTIEIIKQYSHTIDYWESKRDRGIYNAWNKGLCHATGDWICFLGADDYFWNDDVITQMTPWLCGAEDDDIGLVYGRVAMLNDAGATRQIVGSAWKGKESIKRHEMPPYIGSMHRRDVLKEIGGFNEAFQIAGDYECLLRELASRNALFASDVIIAGMQYGGKSVAARHLCRLIYEDIKARRNNGYFTLNYFSLRYYFKLAVNAYSY